ncbi:MAG TPA: 2Fe-2S iron-sulfur cluster-binding protein [Ktedonobacterales bacterium]|nr:2Fe-2S iron-sulfur cluster-binding protein [Ktedonobacterales bacterium]
MALTHVAPTPAQPGTAAPSRFMLAQVVGRAVTARNTVTFWLAAPGTTRAPTPYLPGQFVTLALPGATRQQVIYRSYSLCGDGRPDQPWEITIKRRVGGLGSGFLHDRVTPGMTLPVSAPGGAFTLPQPQEVSAAKTFIFVAAGSGITPIYGMLRALATLPSTRRPHVQLHYTFHSPQDAIYGDAINALDPQGAWLRQWRYISGGGQRMSVAQIMAAAGAQAPYAEWYLCGPTDLMRAVESSARQIGAAPERIHTERFFSPTQRTARAAHATGKGQAVGAARVRVAETGAVLQASAGETLLEALERHGYEADFSCRAGSCGTCRLKVLSGQVRNSDGQALTPAERAAGYVESCVAQPVGEVTIALDGVAALAPNQAIQATRAQTPAAGGRAGGRAAAMGASRRAATRRRARWTLAVASIALFGIVWNLTDHTVATTSASSSGTNAASSSNNSSSSSGASNSSSTSGSNTSSSSSSSSSNSGSSGFNLLPGPSSSSNSSSGVS